MTIEEKKAKILEILRFISDDEESAKLWLETPSPAYGHRSPQALMHGNEAAADLVLNILEGWLRALRGEILKERILTASTLN